MATSARARRIDAVTEAGAATLTTPEEAKQYADETGIDVLAPAVGSKHGMLPGMITGQLHQHLDIPLIAAIKKKTGLPLTLHGGSGTPDEELRQAVEAGINVVHVSTELRVAWRRGLESTMAKFPDEIVPSTLFSEASARVTEVMRDKIQQYGKLAA